MRIKDRPEYAQKPKPLTCRPDATVAEAVREMSRRNYGSIVVVDAEDRVVGLMTERDLMRRVTNEGRDAATRRVEAVMTREVRVAREDDDLEGWLRAMSNERFRRLPIVDAEGKLVSIMTQGDFVSYTWPDLLRQASTLAKASYASNYELVFIAGGVLVYSVVLVAMLSG